MADAGIGVPMVRDLSEEERSDRWRQLTNEDYPPPKRLFAVVSWGCAATNWLSNVLNDCPGVFCVHQSAFYWEQFAGATRLDGVDYLQIVGMLGTAAQAAGDVHGIARSEIPKIREAFGDRFRAMVLVREPLSRLRSQLALFERYQEVSSWPVQYLDQAFPEVMRALPTGSYSERLFVHGINMLNAIVDEIDVGPIIRMEDMTTRPDSLTEIVDYLTGGTVIAPESWATAATASRATNRHARTNALSFVEWQRQVIKDVLDPRALQIYRNLGYAIDIDGK